MLSRTEPTNGDCLYRNREKTAVSVSMDPLNIFTRCPAPVKDHAAVRAGSRLCNSMQTFARGRPRVGGKNHTADKFLDPLRK